jgi:uncharacterized membrane protein HdeD (DUF308 family)
MAGNRQSESDRVPRTVEKSIIGHWILFLVEASALILLGLLAVVVPSIASVDVTVVLRWLFLISGAVGLATTYWARQARGSGGRSYRLCSRFLSA